MSLTVWALTPWAIALLGVAMAWTSQVSLRVKGLWWAPMTVSALAVAVLVVVALLRSRWWQALGVRLWLLFWMAWALSAAIGWLTLPSPGESAAATRWVAAARNEVMLMAACAALTGALLALSRGRRCGTVGFRWLWLGVLVTTAPVALREILANEHIVATRWAQWNFAPNTPAGTFSNPNNYACVLVAVVGTLLAWSLDRVPRWVSAALVVASAGAAWLAWTTASRGAFAAVAMEVMIAAGGLGARLGWWQAVPRSRTARFVSVAAWAALGAVVVAAFTLPALASRNPLLGSSKGGQEASDGLRVTLIRAGLRYWQESPWVGIGPAGFESRLSGEKPIGVPDPTINAHNGFVELLAQYGVLVALPLAALLALVLWHVVRPPTQPGGDSTSLETAPHNGQVDPRDVARRVELACLMVAFCMTASVVSSSLALPMWFVMLAHAVALTWSNDLDRRGRGISTARLRAPSPPITEGCC